MLAYVRRLLRQTEGAALPEYALLVALIAVAAIVAVTAVGTNVASAFSSIANSLAAAL